MKEDKLFILAFGVYPGDAEAGMGGTLAKYSSLGKDTGICDLTEAELSPGVSVAERKNQARSAAEMLGVKKRVFLDFPDRGLYMAASYVDRLVSVIRKYRPEIICIPAKERTKPDFASCASLVKEAVHSAGIDRYRDSLNLPSHSVRQQFSYLAAGFQTPDFVLDITDYTEIKKAGLGAYETDSKLYIEHALFREQHYGSMVQRAFGEGFFSTDPILINELPGEEK
ncbi:bacillithiol biosynthesis deacetylase BshB1 [Bacillus mangrovi]|uniref:Bacillithiol biosynthesis deacetylase BshB1 n=1 Tax=Metabacillus mangrovi TaxID=1491830 RepID=A0A7X2S228_9BACI|nr:bacillithiol biosynthesis deacetylase BshB1 [Metabacillus mangrovi]MTH52145.1 bacillithiol biosynthesis deacetylase BshB1 [Metabacillus mangrovi]